MEYYIQGSSVRAKEIREAFEIKGCTLYCLVSNCDSEDLIYYSLNGRVRAINKDNLYLFESNPNYKKLELSVEPKFKINDWIIFDRTFTIPIQIVEVNQKDNVYVCRSVEGLYGNYNIIETDKNYHLWTIKDANDGDILVSGIDNPFIYNGNIEFSSIGAYIGISRNGMIRLDMFPSRCWTSVTKVKPATKEQCNFLFDRLEEEGYEWDKKKKELKKCNNHKFKFGDWIANDYCAGKVIALTDDSYLLDSGQGIPFSCEHNAHLWSIEDAKDGDVLACSDWLFILKQFNVKGNQHKTYCHYDLTLNRFKDDTDSYMVSGSDEFHPANKEQRDLLFAKMQEAGYQWDKEKLKLEKI